MKRTCVLLLIVGFVLGVSAIANAEMIDGSMFSDHFTGTSLDLDIWDGEASSGSGTITYDSTSPGTVTIDSYTGGYSRLRSDPITFPANSWGAEVRFKITGTLDITDANNYLLPELFSTARLSNAGIALGVIDDSTGPTGSTYSLSWGTLNTTGSTVIKTDLVKDTYYTVTAYLRADGTNVDIYLDGDLITTQTVFAGTYTDFFVGDTWSTVEAHMTVDYVKVGGMVPEPGTLSLLACSLIGLLAYAWRKRK